MHTEICRLNSGVTVSRTIHPGNAGVHGWESGIAEGGAGRVACANQNGMTQMCYDLVIYSFESWMSKKGY